MSKRNGGRKDDGKSGSIWDNPYGGLFDLNHDGKEDMYEQMLAMEYFEEWEKAQKQAAAPQDDPSDSPGESEADDDAVDEYAWRESCDDGSDVGIDPEDYETEETYDEALESARNASPEPVTAPITLSVQFRFPGQEALEAIREADYPNKRKYDMACQLCEVRQGTAIIPTGSTPEEELARCEFALSSDAVAAGYLTRFDGFLFVQAVKEHFALPISVPDEDREVVTDFGDFFLELAEEDTPLAVKAWSWCVREFGSYCRYMKNTCTIYNGILISAEDYPPEFVGLVVQEMAAEPDFLTGVLEKNPAFPWAAEYIAYALEHGQAEIAVRMFRSAIAHPAGRGKTLEDFIARILSCCENWDELETMEAFKFHLLPIVAQIADKRIRRLLPKFQERVDSYICSVESTCEQYRYSRRFAWRNSCADGSAYGVDPLDYETEAEYNKAILQEKYAWRRWRSGEATQYGLNVAEYETEDDFLQAVAAEREKRHPRQVRPEEADPLADTDMTVYTLCGVSFPGSDARYYYRTEDDSLTVGDRVIVPVGRAGKEAVAEIVTVEKHRRRTAPYPVDQARWIKCRYVPEEHAAPEGSSE